MPTASIIIPAHNAEAYIKKTIDSVLAQTFTDFECIVIDDGSTDDTVKAVAEYIDDRIKIIEQKNSGGPAKPRNVGIAAAKGKYIFMFDSDDLMHPKKLELSIAAMEKHSSADFLFSNFTSIDEHNNILKPNFLEEYHTLWNLCGCEAGESAIRYIDAKRLYAALVAVNFIGTSSVVLRRESLSKSDVFNEELNNSDDRLFWILFSKNHDAIFINESLHQYRVQPNGISGQDFLQRGPSKIQALEIARVDCSDKDLNKILTRQIANDYLGMSYSYKTKMDYKNELNYALKSLSEKFTVSAVKLFLHGVFKMSISR